MLFNLSVESLHFFVFDCVKIKSMRCLEVNKLQKTGDKLLISLSYFLSFISFVVGCRIVVTADMTSALRTDIFLHSNIYLCNKVLMQWVAWWYTAQYLYRRPGSQSIYPIKNTECLTVKQNWIFVHDNNNTEGILTIFHLLYFILWKM